jgi:hypothetical protein
MRKRPHRAIEKIPAMADAVTAPSPPAFPVILKQSGYPLYHFEVIFVQLPDSLDQSVNFRAQG